MNNGKNRQTSIKDNQKRRWRSIKRDFIGFSPNGQTERRKDFIDVSQILRKMVLEVNNISEFECEFKKVMDRVEFLLTHNEIARDSDITLCFLYWYKFENLEEFQGQMSHCYSNYSDLFDLSGKLTPSGTITRARRYIQNVLNKFESSQEAKEERIRRQEDIKEFMIKNK